MDKKHLLWIIPLTLVIGFLLASIGVQEVYNEKLEFLVLNGNNCQDVNNNYAMFQFEEDDPLAKHKLLKVEFDENCNLQNIFEWVEEDDSFKTIYFRGYN